VTHYHEWILGERSAGVDTVTGTCACGATKEWPVDPEDLLWTGAANKRKHGLNLANSQRLSQEARARKAAQIAGGSRWEW